MYFTNIDYNILDGTKCSVLSTAESYLGQLYITTYPILYVQLASRHRTNGSEDRGHTNIGVCYLRQHLLLTKYARYTSQLSRRNTDTQINVSDTADAAPLSFHHTFHSTHTSHSLTHIIKIFSTAKYPRPNTSDIANIHATRSEQQSHQKSSSSVFELIVIAVVFMDVQ